MNAPPRERRRWPRLGVEATGRLTSPLVVTARVKDVSPDGVLLSMPGRMEGGERCRLKAVLGGSPLDADVEIRHVRRERRESDSYRVGARFVSLDSSMEAVLRDWLASMGKGGGQP